MDSLERLSNALHTSTADDDVEQGAATIMQDETPSAIAQLSEDLAAAKELKGENKAATIHKKSKRKMKHGLKGGDTKKQELKEKRRPRYFVQF